MPTTGDTELRFLSASERRRLADLLDPADAWRELASRIVVPVPGSQRAAQAGGACQEDCEDGSSLPSLRFLISPHNMRILDQQRHFAGSSPTQVLLDFWSTTGRRHERPRVSDLLALLLDCRLMRAAKFVAVDILGQQDFGDEPSLALDLCRRLDLHGLASSHVDPSAPLPSILSSDLLSPELMPSPSAPSPESASLALADCPELPFAMLAAAANQFEEGECSHKIGEGAFGSVFKACLPDGRLVAVKVLKRELLDQQFVNEVTIMRKFRHENLLPLIGVSTDGPSPCLVYKYMPLGSVRRFLSGDACLGRDLSCAARVAIAIGTARGLAFLHTAFEQPFVHRDVKSDNILLDCDLSPRVGDFGLTRVGSAGTGMTRSRQFTQNVFGTSVYMAPEAFRGDVSVKLDSFAFGVVLLELLTGLEPYDKEEGDLLTLVEDRLDGWSEDEGFRGESIVPLLDPKVADWDTATAEQLAVIARRATCDRKKNRPTVTQILDALIPLSTSTA